MKIATFLALLLLIASSGTVIAQDNDPGHLNIWVGHWKYHTQDFETQYGHADSYDGTGDCSWSPNHGFVVCDYLNQSASKGGVPLNDLVIFTYDPIKKRYSHVGVFKDRSPFVQAMTGEGNNWVTTTELPYKGKTVIYRTTYNFASSATRTTITDISADKGKTWTVVTKFTSTQQTA